MTESDVMLPTGLPGLDAVLGGGLDRPALSLIIGSPGAGKTILASQILFHAARQGLQTLVLTAFSEGNDQYIAHLRSLEFFEPTLLSDTVQLFTLQSQLSTESPSPAGTIVQTIRSTSAKIILIDGLQGAAPLLPKGRASARCLQRSPCSCATWMPRCCSRSRAMRATHSSARS